MVETGFKPCYKWNAFNTKGENIVKIDIDGCFKPCYKWNAFNTLIRRMPVIIRVEF